MEDTNLSKMYVQDGLGVTSWKISKIDVTTSERGNYSHTQPKLYVTVSSALMSNLIYDCFHSEESSTINPNSRQIIKVNGETYVGRV